MNRIAAMLLLSVACFFTPEIHAQSTIDLAWDPVPDGDLANYRMYRDIIPGTMVYLDSIPKTALSYSDINVMPDEIYYYKITAVDSAGNESKPSDEVMAGTGTITLVEENQNTAIHEFSLKQNYPSPFNPSTTIEYRVPTDSQVRIIVFDALGHQIRRLEDGFKTSGLYRVVWDGKDDAGKQVASGIYLYQMIAGGFSEVRKTAFAK